jgi:hypothetical protein
MSHSVANCLGALRGSRALMLSHSRFKDIN